MKTFKVSFLKLMAYFLIYRRIFDPKLTKSVNGKENKRESIAKSRFRSRRSLKCTRTFRADVLDNLKRLKNILIGIVGLVYQAV
jgi:hypothetical protein